MSRAGLVGQLRGLPGRVGVRLRLTLVYGGLFFLAGAVLLTVTYVLVGQILEHVVVSPQGGTLLGPDAWRELVDRLSAQYRSRVLGTLLRQELVALVLVGVCAVVLGYLVADRALSPLHKVTTTARELSESTLHERIALHGPDDEIKELADTFDAMLSRLQWAFDAQRRFVANASHELRTPLAINRTLLEVALGDPEASADLTAVGRTLLATNARHERLIEGLLLLARSERQMTTRTRVDLADVARSALDTAAPDAERAGVTVLVDPTPAVTVGDPVLLERMISNLVDNAIRYNIAEDGRVWLRTGVFDGAVTCQVANTGPVVAPYETDGLFEAFRRLSDGSADGGTRVEGAARGADRGAGLGLSIVASVARVHGGTAAATPRPGGGLVLTVRLAPDRGADGVVSSGRPEGARYDDRC